MDQWSKRYYHFVDVLVVWYTPSIVVKPQKHLILLNVTNVGGKKLSVMSPNMKPILAFNWLNQL